MGWWPHWAGARGGIRPPRTGSIGPGIVPIEGDTDAVTWEVAVKPMPVDATIFVAGHRGLVGSAVLRRLAEAGYTNVRTATREQLDLRDQTAVNHWFQANRPEYVFLVAGTVGGIMANSTR